MAWANGTEFEAEVRRIARALWGRLDGDGGPRMIDNQERDCIFEAEDITHYIECTLMRTLDKIRKDATKMTRYRDDCMRRGKLVKLWIVTGEEPTPDQRTEARNRRIEIMSLQQFERKLLDVDGYLEFRKRYRFGSALNPDDDSPDLTSVVYQHTAIREECREGTVAVSEISSALANNEHMVLLGDYGMGKSLTMREIFVDLHQRRRKGIISQTPVLLNLRDHWGQKSVAEALERHAREIGFPRPEQLVRALNAGRLIVMLDGFDETASSQWQPREGAQMREIRRAAVTLVKRFAELCAGTCGFLVAGRDHYFDSRSEMRIALGLSGNHRELILDGFTLDEMKSYLRGRGFTQDLPAWLPNRPVLLAYLSKDNLLSDVLAAADTSIPARAWESVVERVCAREASIHEYLGADSIRQILEILASDARSTSSGLGPILENDIFRAFSQVTQMDADETARPLLMRLPGLTLRAGAERGRNFLDDQLLDVLRAGDVYRFVCNPYADPAATKWQHCMGQLGLECLLERLRPQVGCNVTGLAVSACSEAKQRWRADALALDLVQAARVDSDAAQVEMGGITIENASLALLDLTDGACPGSLTLKNVAIGDFIAPVIEPASLKLVECVFERVIGYGSASELPPWMVSCDAIEYDDAATNADILRDTDLRLEVRVAVTMLRKLFMQRGNGRKEGALMRGMDQPAQIVVRKLLPLLQSEGIAFRTSTRGNNFWHPIQGQRPRVQVILRNPSKSSDPFMARVLLS